MIEPGLIRPVPDGVYDNLKTWCREIWQGDRPVAFAHKEVLNETDLLPERFSVEVWSPSWGHFPDLPRVTK